MFTQSQLVWEYIYHAVLKTKPHTQYRDETNRHSWSVYLHTKILGKCVYLSANNYKIIKV